MRGGATTDRRQFDDPRADEAARFLDRDVDADDVEPLIRGIDRIPRVRAWRAVERNLGRGIGGGPRSGILDLLEEREATLDDIGERPDRLSHGPRQSYDEWQDADPPKSAAEVKTNQETELPAASDDDVVQDAFATDGGETDGD